MTESGTTEIASDGRRARRDRNRTAVIDAMFELLQTGEIPSTEALAERAGVSVSSVFRYFDGLADLQQQTIDSHFTRFGRLFDIPEIGEGDRAGRIARFVAARVTLYATVAPVARLARARQYEVPLIGDRLHATRATFTDQIQMHFAAELGALARVAARDVVAAIDALTSFEAWDMQRRSHGRSDQAVARTWTGGIDALLPDP